ncbi:hypothetical protein VTL71DRAFT_9277 [Oculimacula yallundae]|uniref:Rrn9 domain-containing protein n=1 Tax=Oculimacula yallundae TaxID=86028 RepID=A0ABR4BTV0_9HELO
MSSPKNTSSSDPDEYEETRPNRWTGPPTSWLNLTEPERGLADSLDTIRNADLSVHLFNAHALRRRARELEGAEDSEAINEFPGMPKEDQAFNPPKSWTAWPLPPEDVPRTGERIGTENIFDEYTFKREEYWAPSRELEDVLTGVTLRFAKEIFMGRKEGIAEVYADRANEKARMDIEEDVDDTGSEYHNSSDEESAIEEATRSPKADVFLKPVVSADDEHSRQLLLPSIRHTLSKLDEVLMALHHARKTCYRYSHSEAGTTDDDESIADTNYSEQGPTSPSKRPVGRPRKFANLPNRAKADSYHGIDAEPQHIDKNNRPRSKSTQAGRPKKTYDRLDGETQQDYLIRVARLQKKPLPVFAPPAEPKSPGTSLSPRRGRSRSQSAPARRATSEELRILRRRKLGLRDWSEVLGIAALVGGFDKDVLDRAMKRCTDLFGEEMLVNRMEEVPFAEREGGNEVVRYVPEFIPAFEAVVGDSSSSDDGSGVDSDSESDSKSESEHQTKIMPGARTASHPSRQAVFCPIPACPRRIQGFKDVPAMKRHLERGHKILKEDVEDYILPSDEEMDGAVHVDGFLRPVKRATGLRGQYRKKGAKKRKASESESESDEDENGGSGNGYVDDEEDVVGDVDAEGDEAESGNESSDSRSE